MFDAIRAMMHPSEKVRGNWVKGGRLSYGSCAVGSKKAIIGPIHRVREEGARLGRHAIRARFDLLDRLHIDLAVVGASGGLEEEGDELGDGGRTGTGRDDL